MANPKVVDISHWQPEPDFPLLKAGGTLGVILKATESTGYVDPTLKPRASAALKAGLSIATYHFLRPGNYDAQMQHYLDTIDPVQGERVCLDHEDAGVSLDSLRACVEMLILHPSRPRVTIYSGHVIKEQLAGQRDEYLALHTDLWIAHYTTASQPAWPNKTWPEWKMWQYTDKAKVSGIDGNVDGNRFNGADADIALWMTPLLGAPTPVPPPETSEVVLRLTPGSSITYDGKVIWF